MIRGSRPCSPTGRGKPQSIRSVDIHQNAVGQSELRGAGDKRGPAVHSYQIGKEQVKSYQIKDGSVHEKDLSQGVKDQLGGGDGGGALSGYYVANETVNVASGDSAAADVQCKDGTYAVGGGVTAPDSTRGYGAESDLVTNVSGPTFAQLPGGGNGADGWHTVVTNNNEEHDLAYLAWVQCAPVE